MNLIIFDINKDFILEAKRLEKYSIKTIVSDVDNLLDNNKIDMIVSPANSFGLMQGGIDKVYTKIFPGIEKIVQNKIKEVGFTTPTEEKYLTVGSAITVKTNNPKCPYLVSAPTMYYPGSNIGKTNNVYLCFSAVLQTMKKNRDLIIACPGLGTNIGMVKPKDAVDQMILAIEQGDNTLFYIEHIMYSDDTNILYK